MNWKDFFNNLKQLNNNDNYNFSLLNDSTTTQNADTDSTTKIFSTIKENRDFLKFKYNALLNSDIVFRDFTLAAHDKLFDAFIIYIDGLCSSDLINNFTLRPLMLRNAHKNELEAKKAEKFDLVEYINNCLLPENSVEKVETFEDTFNGINMGNCLLFVDTLNVAFSIDVKSFEKRSITPPIIETVIKGANESFIENIRTNTSLIRRIINNENLVIENIAVGSLTKTKCGVCYMQNIANSDLVAEVKYRLRNLEISSLASSGQLEQLLSDDCGTCGVPQIIFSERPDRCAQYLLQGRVVILVNGSPYGLIMPATVEDFLFSPEDRNLQPLFANFLRVIRIISTFITLLLPGIYMAVVSFHQELLPTELLFSIIAARENVPFPIIFELLLMELSFEIIREAGLRVPTIIGSTMGIVGGLILGDAAVNANIVSPILIVVVAITGIASFAIPDYSFSFHLRVFRFLFILLGSVCGFLGIGIGFFAYLTLLASIKSFGVPYTTPFAPRIATPGNNFFVSPAWKQEKNLSFLSPKEMNTQDHISKKWRFFD